MGILLKTRDYLISQEYDQLVQEDDSESLNYSIKTRMLDLMNEGYDPDQVKEIIKLEYPEHIRIDIVARQQQVTVTAKRRLR